MRTILRTTTGILTTTVIYVNFIFYYTFMYLLLEIDKVHHMLTCQKHTSVLSSNFANCRKKTVMSKEVGKYI